MLRPTLAAATSFAIICTMSSRTSPFPPGNWCDAFIVICACADADSTAATATVAIVVANILMSASPVGFFAAGLIAAFRFLPAHKLPSVAPIASIAADAASRQPRTGDSCRNPAKHGIFGRGQDEPTNQSPSCRSKQRHLRRRRQKDTLAHV